MSDVVIRSEGLGKKYIIGHESERERYTAMRDVIARGARNFLRKARDMVHGLPIVEGDEVEEVWALRDVNFEVSRGELVGVIGRNGSGKSTLLKVLSRITDPSEGRVTIKGRVASLLEVGTGFHPELTGRENVFLNGAILGMARAEIKRKFDEIVAFAEVERFLDTPVKRYSSGMYLRLAFAVAAHLEPDILLVDEVLAVGDAAFQKKSSGKMTEVAREGRTVLFVSHNMEAILSLCPRTICLAGGLVREVGESRQVVSHYLEGSTRAETEIAFPAPKEPSGEAAVARASLKFDGKVPTNGEDLALRFVVKFFQEVDCNVSLLVYREEALAFVCSDFHAPVSQHPFLPGQVIEFSFEIPKYVLNPGQHSFGFFLVTRGGNFRQILRLDQILPIEVRDDGYRRGGQYLLGWGGAVSPLIPVYARPVSPDEKAAM